MTVDGIALFEQQEDPRHRSSLAALEEVAEDLLVTSVLLEDRLLDSGIGQRSEGLRTVDGQRAHQVIELERGEVVRRTDEGADAFVECQPLLMGGLIHQQPQPDCRICSCELLGQQRQGDGEVEVDVRDGIFGHACQHAVAQRHPH